MTTNLPAILSNSKAKLPAIIADISKPDVVRPSETPVDVPGVVTITAEIASAVKTLALHTVAEAPALTVTERRKLTPAEIDTLSHERSQLDIVEAYIKARKEAHRAMVFNHLDVELESELGGVVVAEIDSKGHYLVQDEVTRRDGARKFVRQISSGTVSLSADDLAEQVGMHGEDFTHADYLACTTQVRVLDEEKALIHLRKRPGMVKAWREAIKRGASKASLYHRPA